MINDINDNIQRKLNIERLKIVYKKVQEEKQADIKAKLDKKLADIEDEKINKDYL